MDALRPVQAADAPDARAFFDVQHFERAILQGSDKEPVGGGVVREVVEAAGDADVAAGRAHALQNNGFDQFRCGGGDFWF
jgi:hypothetical protein